jgi:threonine dehydrogenase-like Zn-dependent dehydrogenase
MGHEFIGVVEDAGPDVSSLQGGDLVIAPFAWSDGTLQFCRDGLQTSCETGGFWNSRAPGRGSTACSGRTPAWPAAPPRPRAYIEPLLLGILDGTVNPGRVFDRTVTLEQTPDGYRAMDDRSLLKVIVTA